MRTSLEYAYEHQASRRGILRTKKKTEENGILLAYYSFFSPKISFRPDLSGLVLPTLKLSSHLNFL